MNKPPGIGGSCTNKSIIKRHGEITINPIFHFFRYFSLRIICEGVTDVFSSFNRFNFTYQYKLPCNKMNSNRKKEIQKEKSEYNFK
jgi:hypothetical protein